MRRIAAEVKDRDVGIDKGDIWIDLNSLSIFVSL